MLCDTVSLMDAAVPVTSVRGHLGEVGVKKSCLLPWARTKLHYGDYGRETLWAQRSGRRLAWLGVRLVATGHGMTSMPSDFLSNDSTCTLIRPRGICTRQPTAPSRQKQHP